MTKRNRKLVIPETRRWTIKKWFVNNVIRNEENLAVVEHFGDS